MGQVEADAVTFFLIFTSLKVGRKQLINVCRCNAWPIVLNRDSVAHFAGLLLLFADNQSDFAVHVGVLERVRNQINNDLLGAQFVNSDVLLLFRHGNKQLDLLHVDLALKGSDRRNQHVIDEPQRLQVQVEPTRVN